MVPYYIDPKGHFFSSDFEHCGQYVMILKIYACILMLKKLLGKTARLPKALVVTAN